MHICIPLCVVRGSKREHFPIIQEFDLIPHPTSRENGGHIVGDDDGQCQWIS